MAFSPAGDGAAGAPPDKRRSTDLLLPHSRSLEDGRQMISDMVDNGKLRSHKQSSFQIDGTLPSVKPKLVERRVSRAEGQRDLRAPCRRPDRHCCSSVVRMA